MPDEREEGLEASPHDELEAAADRLLGGFWKERTNPEQLRQAAELYRKSIHPEGKEIAALIDGMYLFERGKIEGNPQAAIVDICRAYRMHRRGGFNRGDLIGIRLAWLKRRIDLAFARDERHLLPRFFLRIAQLLQAQGRMHDFHVAMYMHNLQSVVANLPRIDEDTFKYFDRMMIHAKESGDSDMLNKAQVMLHRVRASLASNPAEATAELEKSLEAIKRTSDHFGEDEARGSLAFSRALFTESRKKRQKLLAEATGRFIRSGEPSMALRAASIAAPFPIVVGAILDDLKAALSGFSDLQKTIHSLVTGTGPSAAFYHLSYLRERTEDVVIILQRLGATRKELTGLAIKEARIRSKQGKPGVAISRKLQATFARQAEIRPWMKLDMETLYIFGNLVLDQWAIMIAYFTGLKAPEKFSFHGLMMMLQAKDYDGILKPIWTKHRRDVLWFYYQLRFYRNIFVEHIRRPWQRGTTMTVYGDDFNLFIPTPPGWDDEAKIRDELQSLLPYAPRYIREAPDDYWERKNLRRLLEVTFMHVDEIAEQEGRDRVWRTWSRVGGSTPSYEVIAFRLARLLKESIPTISEIVSAHADRINLSGSGPRTMS